MCVQYRKPKCFSEPPAVVSSFLFFFLILLFLKTILSLQERSGEVTIPDPKLNWGCLYPLFDAPTRVTELGVIIGSLCLRGTAYPKQFLNYHWHEPVRKGRSWECLDTAAKTSSPIAETSHTEGGQREGPGNCPWSPQAERQNSHHAPRNLLRGFSQRI